MWHSVPTPYIDRKAKAEDGSNSSLSLQLLGWARWPEEGLLDSVPSSHTDCSGSKGPQAPLHLSSPRWGEVVGGGWLPSVPLHPCLCEQVPRRAGGSSPPAATAQCPWPQPSTLLGVSKAGPAMEQRPHGADGHRGRAGVWGFPGLGQQGWEASQAHAHHLHCGVFATWHLALFPLLEAHWTRNHSPVTSQTPGLTVGARGTHRLRSVPGRYWENRECSSGMSLRSHHRFSHRSPGDAGHDEQDSVSWKENRLSASRPQTPSTIGLFPPKQSKDRDRIPWDIHIHWQWNYIC